MDKENCCYDGEPCDCKCECEKASYDDLERELDKARGQLNRKDNLIEGLQNAIITNTCRIRDLESDREYWQNRYYRENERANDYYNRLKALQESNKED